MNAAVPCKTPEEFSLIRDALSKRLTTQLESEAELDEFMDDDDDSDLWETPAVDSKSVVKLSPIVEEFTGLKIKPEWIKPGGYDTVEDAVKELIRQLELDFKGKFSNDVKPN